MTVAVRVRHRSSVGYISTGVDVGCAIQGRKVQPNWYDGMITNKEPQWLEKNQEVARFVAMLDRRYAALVNPGLMTCQEVCQALKAEGYECDRGAVSLAQAAADYMEDRQGAVSRGYCQMVRLSVERLCSWVGGTLMLQQISAVMLRDYRKHMERQTKEVVVKEAYYSTQYKQMRYRRTVRTERALSDASINKELSHIKAVVNYAIGAEMVRYDVHPFQTVVIPRSARKETDVEPEAICRLRDAELKNGNHQLARDVFLLSFYTGGMNYKDILNADWSSDTVVYVREKTKTTTRTRRTVKVPIVPEAREILERRTLNGKWCSGLRYTNSRDEISYIGKHLKEVVRMLGLPDYMTYYSARKSFSQFALDIGISDVVTSYLLGHSESQRGVIAYYSRVTSRMAGLALRKVIDYANDPSKFAEEIEKAIMA